MRYRGDFERATGPVGERLDSSSPEHPGVAASIEELHRIKELAHRARILLRDSQRFIQEKHTRCDGMDMDKLSDHRVFDCEIAFGLFWELDTLVVRLEAQGA